MIENIRPSHTAAESMKLRLRADLTMALKQRLQTETRVVRTLITALDNAEAPPAGAPVPLPSGCGVASTSVEVPRLVLTAAEIETVIVREIEEYERAARELAAIGRQENADDLRQQADIARRYLA